jgi:hypothetical protein
MSVTMESSWRCRMAGHFANWFQRTRLDCHWADYADELPVSRVYEIADEARRRTRVWAEFATSLEKRVRRND